jgi:propanol-preferring alcohol dehydrogenase
LEYANKLHLTIEKEIVPFNEVPNAMIRLKKGDIKGMVQVIEIL